MVRSRCTNQKPVAAQDPLAGARLTERAWRAIRPIPTTRSWKLGATACGYLAWSRSIAMIICPCLAALATAVGAAPSDWLALTDLAAEEEAAQKEEGGAHRASATEIV